MKTAKSLSLAAFILCMALLSLSFASKPKVVSTDRVNQLVADWERAKAFTKEYLDAANEDVINFKPSPEMRSFAEQMLHLAMGNGGIVSTSTGKTSPFKENIEKLDQFKTKEALIKAVMESYDFVIATLKEMDDQKLAEKVKFFNGQEYTREVGIGKAFEHQTHHRGQTTIYLRLKGVTPPQEKLF